MDGEKTLPDGFFVVRNRSDVEESSFDLASSESQLFGSAPWTSVPSSRRGTSTLKRYLANILSSRIAEEFPSLEENIEKQLGDRVSEQTSMGEPRSSHHVRQNYLNHYAQGFTRMAALALSHPGNLDSNSVELRKEVRMLNDQLTG